MEKDSLNGWGRSFEIETLHAVDMRIVDDLSKWLGPLVRD